jgi:peroxiredoxin Q/BCP
VDSHERWVSEQQLKVPLLADEDLSVARAYGAVAWGSPLAKLAGMPTTAGGHFVKRSIFVIDGEGIVRYRQMSRTGASYQSVDDLEAAVATLRA